LPFNYHSLNILTACPALPYFGKIFLQHCPSGGSVGIGRQRIV
jgi:hypothetical protein